MKEKDFSPHFLITPIIALTIGVFATWMGYSYTNHFISQRRETEFESLTNQANQVILNEVDLLNQTLISAKGFFDSSVYIDRSEWHNYVENLISSSDFAGLKAMNVVTIVTPEEIESFLSKQVDEIDNSHQQFSNFQIKPQITNPSYVVNYVEPHYGNLEAFGYNVATNPNQLPAFERAIETEATQITNITNLVQNQNSSPAFIMTKAIFDQPESATQSARPTHFVSAVIQSQEFFDSLTQLQNLPLTVRIYDGQQRSPNTLLYESTNHSNAPLEVFTVFRKISVGGQEWLVEYHWDGSYLLTNIERALPFYVVIIGGIISSLVFMVLVVVSSTSARAHQIASNLTKKLEDVNKSLEKQVKDRTKELEKAKNNLEDEVEKKTEDLKEKVDELEKTNKLMIGREVKMRELKQKISYLEEKNES